MTEFRVQTSHPHRLLGVLGDRGKTNDVIFCKSPFECSNTLVFFPGDVQDYLEEMSPEFSEYNIGSTASLLSSSFPDHHILVIKPNSQTDTQTDRHTYGPMAETLDLDSRDLKTCFDTKN
ncbi:hypothetical protein M8J77_023873 [Diaphorina citri]|nr:hypothetical protein M8J77_023873 [Diaphorina citri]